MMPSWGTYALSIQLFLVFLFPAINLHYHGASVNIFASDWWCIGWVAIAAALQWRKHYKFFICTALLFLFIYAHGYFRSPFMGVFNQFIDEGPAAKPDVFHPLKDFISCIRFLSWVWAARITYSWFSTNYSKRAHQLRQIYASMSVSLILASIILICTKFSSPIRLWIASIYHYDVSYGIWANRAYGTFTSPVEAGATMLFGAVLLATILTSSTSLSKLLTGSAFVFSMTAALLARTFTPFLSLIFCLWIYASNQSKRLKPLILGAGVSVFLLFICLAILHIGPLETKIWDLTFRAALWKNYISAAFLRLDFLLFGFGFFHYHGDNVLSFLMTRGGLLLLVLPFVYLIRHLKTLWPNLSIEKKMIILFIIITNMGLDAIIYRYFAMLFIAVACPLLAADEAV